MHLILTHENADFDAVASQLAAHKLMPGTLPVLPHRLNRNVRHFISLYWDELPFVEVKDLPREPVAHALLVDSQTLPTLRGMSDTTTVAVIDHHSPRESLRPEWKVTLEEAGATTTILVERLREKRIPLSPIEATMLLLGIYEDTGALTYGSTRVRDSYAAAWLMDQGALLDVVREFLNHPLTDDQQALYERLVENARSYEIEGCPVVIASATAPQYTEEIATLAHRLRDLLDPAAIFVLVDLGTHVQMVARSTADALDVGQIAEHFGGGGHGRAAAALIRERTLGDVEQALLALLPRMVRPGLTVADLMSRGVQTLPPAARVRDAARQMRRYGYEGYPVVRDGRVIGLLTRRAVDRALDHGLEGARIEQFMEAGEVSVQPGDSVADLQRVMMVSGWGQVPVIDDEGQIIGVVTRTDLIKHMGHAAPPLSRRTEVARLLEGALPPLLAALVREAGREAQKLGASLYMAGGGVRDLMLGQPTIDVDFVVEGDAIALTRALCARFGGRVRSHDRFGTGKWLLDAPVWRNIAALLAPPPSDAPEAYAGLPSHIDFATARTEFYNAPTVLPEVERSSIKLDLHRRDFTINTLAICLDPPNFGQLLDFYGGEDDLRAGRIRVLHSLSFIDDPTRILRAARFEQRLGFAIEPRTAELIGHAVPLLEKVSGDRLKHEIELILDEQQPERALRRLDELGVLRAIHPALSCDLWTVAAFHALRSAFGAPLWPALADGFDPELPYFALLTFRMNLDDVRALCVRLHVRRSTTITLETVQAIRPALPSLPGDLRPSQIDRLLAPASDEVLVTLWAAAPSAPARETIVDYACRLRAITPTVDGRTLRARGLRPGPVYRTILGALRAAWLDGEIRSEAEEQALLEHLLANVPTEEQRT
jgi:tRNA nucleotidyltransferase (CCA-adding enzyme)